MSAIRGDYALIHEKKGAEQIQAALEEKENLLKLAKDRASKETEDYRVEKEKEMNDKITSINDYQDVLQEIEDKSNREIDNIKKTCQENGDRVIDLLFQNVVKVEYELPDVVKGCFEEKFGIKE